MKFLIYSINYSPELTGIGKYNGEMAEWLIEQGHEVRVVTAYPYYPDWEVHGSYNHRGYMTEVINGVKVFRCPLYVPEKPTTITRIIHLCSFSLFSLPQLFRNLFWRPDIVFTLQPTFFNVPQALLFSKLTNAESVLHIQDFEVDAMFGLGMFADKGGVARLAYKIESIFSRAFDYVSTISNTMIERVHQKGVDDDRSILFPNWVDIDFVTPGANKCRFREMWGVKKDEVMILYSGNIGKKQGFDILLDAAAELKEDSKVKIFIVGEGAVKHQLEERVEREQLTNIIFKPLQDYNDLPDLLRAADIHLVLQKKGAADAVLPSKLTAIFSVGGNVLITAEDHTELGIICDKYPGIAKRVEPCDTVEFTKGLKEYIEHVADKNYFDHNIIGRSYAEQFLDKDAILNSMVETFKKKLHRKLEP